MKGLKAPLEAVSWKCVEVRDPAERDKEISVISVIWNEEMKERRD